MAERTVRQHYTSTITKVTKDGKVVQSSYVDPDEKLVSETGGETVEYAGREITAVEEPSEGDKKRAKSEEKAAAEQNKAQGIPPPSEQASQPGKVVPPSGSTRSARVNKSSESGNDQSSSGVTE